MKYILKTFYQKSFELNLSIKLFIRTELVSSITDWANFLVASALTHLILSLTLKRLAGAIDNSLTPRPIINAVYLSSPAISPQMLIDIPVLSAD